MVKEELLKEYKDACNTYNQADNKNEESLYKAIDGCVLKLESQVQKSKGKVQSKRTILGSIRTKNLYRWKKSNRKMYKRLS